MDCKTARKVWNHEGGFVEGVREVFPEAFERLTVMVDRYVTDAPDAFNSIVKEKVGDTGNAHYRVEHSEGEDMVALAIHEVLSDDVGKFTLETYFSDMFGQKISLSNVCCSGCKVSNGMLSPKQKLAIQMAAVNTDPV